MPFQTLLTHLGKCGGPVSLDVSSQVKLVSPSYTFNGTGIQTVTLDPKFITGNKVPEFECNSCGDHFAGPDDIGTKLGSYCIICGKLKSVKSLFYHERLSPICLGCKDEIKDYKKDPDADVPERIKDFSRSFNITDRTRFICVLDILQHPLSLL